MEYPSGVPSMHFMKKEGCVMVGAVALVFAVKMMSYLDSDKDQAQANDQICADRDPVSAL
jgi:hypothetical protein